MRTIKFRGKCTDDGMWRFGDLLHDNGLLWINDHGLHVTVEESTVGEFVGLKDKNGVDIYEGDKVKCREFEYTVTRSNRFASFCLQRQQDMFLHYFGEAVEADEVEIIGNIYGTPISLIQEREDAVSENTELELEFDEQKPQNNIDPALLERMGKHIEVLQKRIDEGYSGYYISVERMIDIVEYYNSREHPNTIKLSNNDATQRQLTAIRLIDKMKQWFNDLPNDEKLKLYKEMPELFTLESDREKVAEILKNTELEIKKCNI